MTFYALTMVAPDRTHDLRRSKGPKPWLPKVSINPQHLSGTHMLLPDSKFKHLHLKIAAVVLEKEACFPEYHKLVKTILPPKLRIAFAIPTPLRQPAHSWVLQIHTNKPYQGIMIQ